MKPSRLLYLILLLFASPYDAKTSKYIDHHLGTKSPYRFVSNDDLNVGTYPGCKPVKIWMMNRHGTRYPADNLILLMQKKLPTIRNEILKNYHKSLGQLTSEQINNFINWKPTTAKAEDEKILADEGVNEMINLAERNSFRFQEIISKEYDEKLYKFKHTASERAFKSAKSFATGLYGNSTAEIVAYNETKSGDPVLRFYKNCDNWVNSVKKNNATYKELLLYLASPEIDQALANLSNIFGFKNAVSYDTAKMFYQTCAFETAWRKNYTSPWCYAFDASTIQIMEYAEDLKYYWVNGYGFSLSQKIACNVLRDVVELFENRDGQLGAFYFTHSGTILMTLSHFGLYKMAAPLDHSNRDSNRAWRTSYMDTFGSNLAFVLYRCDDDSDKVLTLHQERPVRLPECPEADLCPLQTIINRRKDTMAHCDLAKLCKQKRRDEL